MTLVLFDLDNTLIGGDSDYLWGEFLVSENLVDSQIYRQRNEEFYRDYEKGNLDVAAYLRFALTPLAQLSPSVLAETHEKFMRDCIEPIWLPKAEDLIAQHKKSGNQLAVITSTNRFVVEPIVRKLKIDSLICSEPEIVSGQYTGNFVGIPCFAEGKITKINQWLGGDVERLKNSWFYSDSHNDLPLMREVGTPIAVDPDATLAAQAEARAWKIISLR